MADLPSIFTYELRDSNDDAIESSDQWWRVCQRFREHGYPEGWYIYDSEDEMKNYREYFVGDDED